MSARRIFLILDSERNDMCYGILLYTITTKEFRLQIKPGYSLNEYPWFYRTCVKDNLYEMPSKLVKAWVRERIIPHNRANILDILKSAGLKQYDEFGMLMYTGGRCCQDEDYLKEITEEEYSDYIKHNNMEYIPISNSDEIDLIEETNLFD